MYTTRQPNQTQKHSLISFTVLLKVYFLHLRYLLFSLYYIFLDPLKEWSLNFPVSQSLLNQFYPEKTVAVRSSLHDSRHQSKTAQVKPVNCVMRTGRSDEGEALAVRIGNGIITRQNEVCLRLTSSKTIAKDIWTAVGQLAGRQRDDGFVDGVTAESLNTHYALISTD